jgi:putative chitinase
MKTPSQWNDILIQCGVRPLTAAKWAEQFSLQVTDSAFSAGAAEISGWLANFLHETAYLEAMEENLNYKAEALIFLFGRHRISEADCWTYGRTSTQKANQPIIANCLYGGAWGLKNLGNTQPGDGWKYRGRGAGLTGRRNYARIGTAIGVDLEANPDLATQPEWAIKAFIAFWESHVNDETLEDIRKTRKTVNGGDFGLVEVTALTDKLQDQLA